MSRNLETIVEQQVSKWQRLRQALEAAPRRIEPSAPGPCITVSPEHGSLGLAVAREIAGRLGFELYERELVNRIAESAHVRQQLVESVDQHTQNAIASWINRQLGSAFFAESDYVTNLSRALLTIGQHGQAVIVGRGAQFILHPSYTLRLRVVAPLELRIKRIAEREDLSDAEARAKVMRVEAERAAITRHRFGRDLGDPVHYDLVLNTERLTAGVCADLAVAAFRSRFTP